MSNGLTEERRMTADIDGMEPPLGPCELCWEPHDGDYAVCDDCAPGAPTCDVCDEAPVAKEGAVCGPCSMARPVMEWPVKGDRRGIDGSAIAEAGAWVELVFKIAGVKHRQRVFTVEVDGEPVSGLPGLAAQMVEDLIESAELRLRTPPRS